MIFHRLAPQRVGEVWIAAERTDRGKRHRTAVTFRTVEADLPLIEGSGQWLAAAWTVHVHGMESRWFLLLDYPNIMQETPLFQSQHVNTGLVCLKNRQKRYNKKYLQEPIPVNHVRLSDQRL